MKKPQAKNLKNERINNATRPVLDEELDETELNLVYGGSGHSIGPATGTPAGSFEKKLDDTIGGQQQKIG